MKKKQKLSVTNEEGEVRELTWADICDMQPASEVLPKEWTDMMMKHTEATLVAKRKKPAQKSLTVPYSPKVIKYFKKTGKGWESRINKALENWIEEHPKAA